MSAQVIVWENAAAATITVLRATLPIRPETYVAGVKIHAHVPSNRTIETGKPLVMARPDGSTVNRRVDNRALVRLTCWHSTEYFAVKLAGLVQGILIAYSGFEIRSTEFVSGPLPGTDPDTGTPLATCSIAAHMRPNVA